MLMKENIDFTLQKNHQEIKHRFYTPEESPRNMPDLETEESAKERGQGSKISTP